MNDHAKQMNVVVGELIALVEGRGSKGGSREYAAGRRQNIKPGKAFTVPEKKAGKNSEIPHKAGEEKADQVIPMDEDDFKDF